MSLRGAVVRVGKRFGKRIVSPLLDATGLFDRRLERILVAGTPWTILTYHRVIEDPSLDPLQMGMCIRSDRFAGQMAFLAKRFNVEPMASVVERLQQGRPLLPRTLSITIDDGYQDNADHAFPLLAKLGVPASLYVVTGGLESPRAFWWDRVINAFDASRRRGSIDRAEFGMPAGPPLSLEPLHRTETIDHLLAHLWSIPHDRVMHTVDRIETAMEPARAAERFAPRMRAATVASIATMGFELGAHTVNHPNLTLLDRQAVQCELEESRDALARLSGRPVTGFAYPAGHRNEAVEDAVRKAGFGYALSTCSGTNAVPLEPFALRRIGAPDAPLSDFKRAMTRAMQSTAGPVTIVHEGSRPWR